MARFSIMAAGGGSVRFRGCPVYHGTYLKPSYLEFREISSDTPIAWAVGDYVDYTRTGLRYTLYDLPEMAQNSEKQKVGERYVYSNVRFYARTKDLERCLFRDIVTADNTVHFSSRKTISTFEDVDGLAARIQACLDSGYPGEWSVVLDTDLKTSVTSVSEAREFSIESGSSVLDALDQIYSVWENVGWTYSYNPTTGKHILSIGGANTKRAGNTVAGGSIGKGSGLTSVKVTFSRLDDVCTRLYPFGSSRNMRARYYNSLNIKDAESVDIPNLMIPVSSWGRTDSLPDPKKAFIRVASVRDERLLGVRPKVLYFDDEEYGEIYPSIEGVTIGDVRESMETTDEYYPSTSIYTDSERADEVKSSKTANLDDGTSGVKEITQTVDPVCDASMTGSVGVNGSVTLTKNIGFASLRMGRWSDIILADGQADIYVEMDNGVSLDEAFLTVTNMGNEAKVDLLRNYDSTTGKTRLFIPDDCVLLHDDFFKVSDTNYGSTFIFEIHLTVTASGSKYLQSSSVTVDQNNSAPISISLRDGHPASAYVTLKQIGFDPNLQRLSSNGKVGTLEMKTGACAGRSFRIDKCSYDSSADGWNLKIRRVVDRSVNMTFPNSTYPIAAGDRFVLTDIKMPDEYIEYASQRLLSRAKDVLDELSHPIAVLTPSMNAKFIKENARSFIEGQFLSFEASLLSQGYMALGYYSDLIDTLTINENEANIPTYSLTLRERPRKSFKLPSDSSASNTEDVESGDSSGSGSSSSTAKGDKGDDGVGIKSVTQTTTSTADSGENVVTVELTDGSSSQFKVRNGGKGSPGKDGDTPYVGANGNWWISGVDTGIKAQGQPGGNGAPGAAAGFGSITATAVAVPYGTVPSVDVKTSGPDTEKNISFAFKIPRGASGGGSAEVMTYPEYLGMTGKDENTLYAVTYKGRCDLFLGEVRITNNITEILPTGIEISGLSSVADIDNTAQYSVGYIPSGTTETGVTWEIASGGSYASIDQTGLLTVKSGAKESTVAIRATSLVNPNATALKVIRVTYMVLTYLRVSPTTVNAPADKTQFTNADGTLTIEANQSWTAEVTSGDDWLDIDAVNGTGDGTNGIMLLESNTGSERTGTILFTGADGKTATVTVIQAAAVAAPSITFQNDSKEVTAAAGTVTNMFSTTGLTGLTVTATGGMTITVGPSISGYQIGFAYAANSDSSDKTTTVTLTGTRTDGQGTYSKSFTVTQAAGASSELAPSISLLQDTFSVPATTTSVTQRFFSKNLTGLTATVTGALEGATVNLNEVSKTIVVNFRANEASSERVGTVTVTGTRTDGKGTYSKSFTVTQAASTAGTYLLTVNVSPSDASVSVQIGSGSLTTYTEPVRVAAGVRVIVVAIKSGYVSRSETVMMDSDKTLDWTLQVAPTWTLTSPQTFEANGDGVNFDITDTGNVGWKIVCPDWCILSDGVYEGTGAHSTSLVAIINETGAERSGYVYLYAAGSSSIIKLCKITQEG